MKRTVTWGALVGMVLYLMNGLAHAAGPELTIESPKQGEAIRGGLVGVKVAAKNFKIVDFTKDTAVSEGKGDVHIQLDHNPDNTLHTPPNGFAFAAVNPGGR